MPPCVTVFYLMPIQLLLCALFFAGVSVWAQNVPDYEQPPVSYSSAISRDAAARLQERINSGAVSFGGRDRDVLRVVLRELSVPVESQIVVFAKTSLQRGRIHPQTPRAIYFSDSVYVGWVPGGLIEVAAVDAQLGPVFYTFDPRLKQGASPAFVRDADCLRCHGGAFVRDVPGVFARSVFPDDTGEPLFRHGSEVVGDETPFARRWGGWYVSGYLGAENHRGNVFAIEAGDQLVFAPSDERPATLDRFFETESYLANTSDVVALLVAEHQMAVQNALTRAAQHCRKMLAYQRSLQETLKEPFTDEPAYDSVKSVFTSAVETVLDRLLFRHAAPLPAGIGGSAAFRHAFGVDAPRNADGLSLKDFSLEGRLFAHRCSYLIYSETFASLPVQLRHRILDRLHAELQSNDPGGRYAYIDTAEKRSILDVLNSTLPEARSRWALLTGSAQQDGSK